MSRISAVLLLVTILTVAGSGQQVQTSRPITTREELNAMTLKAAAPNIRSVAKILKDEKVDIDPELLFTWDGRKLLRPQLEKFSPMQSSKFYSDSLHGVVMADTLTFAENIPLEGDAVVIARQIIFNGRAPVIKGPHDLHIFVWTSITAANGPDTVVTIDTSGEGVNYVPVPAESSIRVANASVTIDTSGADGNARYTSSGSPAMPGSAGVSGGSGADGVDGLPGTCAESNVGATGGQGGDGVPGEDGGNGARGIDGSNAHDQTIVIPNSDLPYFQLIAKPGQGTEGGEGGPAGNGGRGGNGGTGGDGIACQCVAGGIGDGGTGGNSGAGGAGGVGGKGGQGGNGGNAAHFVIFQPPRPYDISHLKNYGGSGRGGRGGNGGQGGRGGTAGTPGQPGNPGHVASCVGRNGRPGTPGKPGQPGRSGAQGDWGNWGKTGSLSIF